MPRVLVIDDEPMYFKMVEHALKGQRYDVDYSKNGMEGLRAVSQSIPDVVIIDVRLPDLSGYEVAQRLRRDPRFSVLPIMFLTSQGDLSDKLKAFEVGADDYIVKPFQPEELVARINLLVRRSEVMRTAKQTEGDPKELASIVAVHSLRGGAGTSSVAVNLAVAFQRLWERPTLLVDTVLNAGQVALMLNVSPVHTWDDFTGMRVTDMDDEMIASIIGKHTNGLHYIAAPSYPIAYDSLSDDVWAASVDFLRRDYEMMVIDTAHDFSNVTIQMLNAADHIFMVLAPEMASIRAAVCALNIYEKLGYPDDKIVPVINNIFPQTGIKLNQIEKVLKRTVKYAIPHVPNEFIRAINFGEPVVLNNMDSPVTTLFEDAAFEFSKETLKNIPPVAPSITWKRVNSRLLAKK
jgi:pilus assembly protein CpaE